MSRATTIYLLICCNLLAFASTGCQNQEHVPNSRQNSGSQPPVNVTTLSGGKITHFIGSYSKNAVTPDDKVMLKACRRLRLTSNIGYSVYIAFICQASKPVVSALMVGKQILVQPRGVARFMGLTDSIGRRGYSWQLKGHNVTMASDGSVIIYPMFQRNPQQYILLNPSSKFADVGGRKVALQQPVVWVEPEKEQVMLLSDLLKLFRASDAQTGSHTIYQTKIIYHLPPGGRI